MQAAGSNEQVPLTLSILVQILNLVLVTLVLSTANNLFFSVLESSLQFDGEMKDHQYEQVAKGKNLK